MEIVGNVKNYDWGKLGSQSVVAQLAALNTADFKIQSDVPYSELWMGAHPSGPSSVKSTGEELLSVLPNGLPFLFKVLSVRKALSIQVHPNKVEAEKLHKERPDVYKDPNHKPELAIALTPFLALCGFRPYAEIYKFCEQLPPLQSLLGDSTNVDLLKKNDSSGLRRCYEKLMSSEPADTGRCIESIATNYSEVLKANDLFETFQAINVDFPNDVGVLSLFFLNLVKLQPGQAIFLAANEIHAYLSGDCIECMACSDNVIRAGLTPKYKDVAQLISCLNYAGEPANYKLFQPRVFDQYVKIFAPPVKDFAVVQISLPANSGNYKMQMQPLGSILLVLFGERKLCLQNCQSSLCLKRGSIIYLPPEAAPEIEFQLEEGKQGREKFVAYLALQNAFMGN